MKNEEPVLDMKDVLDRVQDDRELLMELLEIFQDDFIQRRKNLQDALDENDAQVVREVAHAIKGASGNISAKRIFLLCHKMEKAAQAGFLDEVRRDLPSLDEQFQILQKYIKTIHST
ncbi:MAG: Hpt domain-containing protein [Candidatus Omnitrophica bacterium]|nr:Hpt domain-containing protein [Candidatus Omnitrophota bacterium]